MATSNLNEKPGNPASDSMSSSMSDSMRTVRDTADRLRSRVSDQMKSLDSEEMLNRASESATELYDNAQTWARENSRMITLVGGILAVGVIGFFVGKMMMNRGSDIENY